MSSDAKSLAMFVIKLGGSAITDKSKEFSIRHEVVARIPEEIKPALPRVVLVHGAGSYGHQAALRHALVEGYKAEDQLIAAAYLKFKMGELTREIQRCLIKAGIPVFPFHPSSFMIYEDGKPLRWNLEPLKGFFKVGLIPLVPPDGAFDVKRGFSIVSGDVSAAIIAKEMSAKALIFGVDVDGVLDEEGNVIERLSPEEAEELSKRIRASDATGGMALKLSIAADVAKAGIPVYIVNLLVPGRLRSVLEGKPEVCTVVG